MSGEEEDFAFESVTSHDAAAAVRGPFWKEAIASLVALILVGALLCFFAAGDAARWLRSLTKKFGRKS